MGTSGTDARRAHPNRPRRWRGKGLSGAFAAMLSLGAIGSGGAIIATASSAAASSTSSSTASITAMRSCNPLDNGGTAGQYVDVTIKNIPTVPGTPYFVMTSMGSLYGPDITATGTTLDATTTLKPLTGYGALPLTATTLDLLVRNNTNGAIVYEDSEVALNAVNCTVQPTTRTVHIKSSSLDQSCPAGQVTQSGQINITQIGSDRPDSISVTASNPADTMQVPLSKLVGQTAQYVVSLKDGQTITDATATVPSNWTGEFVLSHYGCGTATPPPTCVPNKDAQFTVDFNGPNGTAKVEVKDGQELCDTTQVSIVSYQGTTTGGPSAKNVQTRFDLVSSTSFTKDSGALTVKVPSCNAQVDLIWGTNAPETLDADFFGPNHTLIESWKGSTKCTSTPPVSVTAVSPTSHDVCGTANDTYTIPSTEGVDYAVNGTATAAGTYPGSGTVAITATAEKGYALTGTAAWSFTFTDVACSTPPAPPVVTYHPTASGSVDCTGSGSVVLDNRGSNAEVGYEVVVNGVATPYSVPAGQSQSVAITGAHNGSTVVVNALDNVVATIQVPAACPVPPKQVTPPVKSPSLPPVHLQEGNESAPGGGISLFTALGIAGAMLILGSVLPVRRRRYATVK